MNVPFIPFLFLYERYLTVSWTFTSHRKDRKNTARTFCFLISKIPHNSLNIKSHYFEYYRQLELISSFFGWRRFDFSSVFNGFWMGEFFYFMFKNVLTLFWVNLAILWKVLRDRWSIFVGQKIKWIDFIQWYEFFKNKLRVQRWDQFKILKIKTFSLEELKSLGK